MRVTMNGIIFKKTAQLQTLIEFYTQKLTMSIWLRQVDCCILQKGNLLLGFCQRDSAETQGTITFFMDSCEEVDMLYHTFKNISQVPPKMNEKYGIYHFFMRDPEGRILEIQWFKHHIYSYRSGKDLLTTRRSVRKFSSEPVSDDLLHQVLESTRYAPSARNAQPVYFIAIRNRNILQALAAIRPPAAPIAKAPMAVAIVANPEISRRYVQDGDIAAYHFLLAAWDYGLGTCWIADMDQLDVKRILEIPEKHYISTITPVGYPAEFPKIQERRLVMIKNS